MKKSTLIIAVSVVVGILIIAIVYLLTRQQTSGDKQGFIYTEKVFSDYKGTKIVEEKFIKKQQKQKLELDSLKAVIQVSEAAVKGNLTELQKVKMQAKRNEYMRLMEEYGSENEAEFQQAKQALWIQINQYIKKYGTENGYVFIHGANGTGSLMFADSTYNITEPVVEYINKEFEGK
jgi:outer membrane protein